MSNFENRSMLTWFYGIVSSFCITFLIEALLSAKRISTIMPLLLISVLFVTAGILFCKKQRVLFKRFFKTLGITTIFMSIFFAILSAKTYHWSLILFIGIVLLFVGIVIKKEKPHDIEDVQLETKIPEQNGGIKVVIKEVPVESNQTANNAENKKVYKDSVCKYCGADFNDDDSHCAYCGRKRH